MRTGHSVLSAPTFPAARAGVAVDRVKKLATVLFAFACGCQPTGESTLGLASMPLARASSLPLGYLSPPRSRDAAVAFDAAFAKRYETSAAPPVRLAASDGSELGLKELTATVTVEGPLAHTELHFTFTNPDARQKEGRFSITLPAGAAVGRFAMKNPDGWREARVVSREQGRQVYEAYLKRKIDPALLEQDDGNTFSARVFPITASADKELIVAYDEPVDGDYTLALAGLPPISKLAVDITVDGKTQSFDERGASPVDLVVPVGTGSRALVANKEFVARVQIPSSGAPESLESVLFLVDTSASRAPLFAQQAALVKKLSGSLPSDARIAIAVFDQGVTEVFRGAAHEAEVNGILAHGALGASDLGAALAYASKAGFARVVIVGDGAPTIGEREPAKLAAFVGHGVERVDAVKLGATVDKDVLAAIVASGARPGAILDARDSARLVRQLATALMPEREIHVEGAREVWPATTKGVAPGDPVWVSGRGTLGAIRIGEQAVSVPAATASIARVPRAVARAELAALAERRAQPKADTKKIDDRIREVALANQLVSSQTSLIVLESDEDERRMLGPQPPPAQPEPTAKVDPAQVEVVTGGYEADFGKTGGEVIAIEGRAPIIDPTDTTQGIVIDKNYLVNVPVPNRSFESSLGAAAGAQGDHMGVSFSGASSLQNHYYVDGINAHGRGGTIPPPPLARADMSNFPDPSDPAWVVRQLTDANTRYHEDERHADAPPPAPPPPPPEPVSRYATPYDGKLLDVMSSIADGKVDQAVDKAKAWQGESPGDVQAILALGEALEARGQGALAARAYGSLLDLYPNRAEVARAAGERFDRIDGARALAIDAYRRAIAERPDQASSYRLLAYALYREGRIDEAVAALDEGLKNVARVSIRQILSEDRAIVSNKTAPGLRVILTWETDANDVDLHVVDKFGDESWYSHRSIASGGTLLDDITTGFGPEMFTVGLPNAYPYTVGVQYYNRGPMGVGMGSVMIVQGDKPGDVRIEDRPFVIQVDHAFVELGRITR